MGAVQYFGNGAYPFRARARTSVGRNALREAFAPGAADEPHEADSDRHTLFIVRARDDPNVAAIRAFVDRQTKRKEEHAAKARAYWVVNGAVLRRGRARDSEYVCELPHGTKVWVVALEQITVGEGRRASSVSRCRLSFPYEAWVTRKFLSETQPKPLAAASSDSDSD